MATRLRLFWVAWVATCSTGVASASPPSPPPAIPSTGVPAIPDVGGAAAVSDTNAAAGEVEAPASAPSDRSRAQGERPTVSARGRRFRPVVHFGVGYKSDELVGLVGGDVVVAMQHLGIDLAGGPIHYAGVSGVALSPELFAELFGSNRSSPYIGGGYAYATGSAGGSHFSLGGWFANAGYQLKIHRLWIQGGGGVQLVTYLSGAFQGARVHLVRPAVLPSYELGARWMFR